MVKHRRRAGDTVRFLELSAGHLRDEPQPPMPTRERPLFAVGDEHRVQSPWIAAAAWRTWIMNEQPPTLVPSM